MREVLLAVRDMVRPMAEEKGLRVELEFPWPDQRLGHTRPLSRALLNLATNALKFTERGHVTIGGRATGPSRVEFWVQDTGPGITSDILPRLFQPFVSSKETGLGLGLVISRRIAESHGGGLWAMNSPPGGACFVCRLPMRVEASAVAV